MLGFFKKQARIELYANSFQSTMHLVAQMLPKVMESNAVPRTEAGARARAERITEVDTALLTYAAFRGWVMQSKMPPELRARFIDQIDVLISEGYIFPEVDADALDFQEFWHASLSRAQRDGKSIWGGAAECFLERLGAGGVHGEDSWQIFPLAHALAGNARLMDASLASFKKRFRPV